MRPAQAFATSWCDFIVGDDWRIAAALALTALLARNWLPGWWLLPVAVALMLAGAPTRNTQADLNPLASRNVCHRRPAAPLRRSDRAT